MRHPITLFTRSLECGGAERQLVELAKGLYRDGIDVRILTFYPNGAFENDAKVVGIPIASLNKNGRWDIIPFFFKLCKILKFPRSNILYSYLTVPCILSVFVKIFMPTLKVIWGIRASNMDLRQYDWLSKLSYILQCKLSTFADLVIANSHAGQNYAILHGFPAEKIVVVPNGIDTIRFQPLRDIGMSIRKEWEIEPHEKLIGIVARLDPMKDHPTFIKAASLLIAQQNDVKFVCIGDGPMDYKERLLHFAIDIGLNGKLIWAGARQDMPAVYNALDVAVLSSSYGEGFPNVIGEAMACGLPCVVTDVGDAAWIVGDTGIVVKPRDPEALAAGMIDILARRNKEGGKETFKRRERICEHFGLDSMVAQTENALSKIK